MPPFELKIEDVQSSNPGKTIKILHLKGQLDESNIDIQAETIYKMIDTSVGIPMLILDLKNLDYMNSKAIGYLTDWAEKIQAKKGQLIACCIPKNIADVLETVGLGNFIPFTQNQEEAISIANNFGSPAV